MIKKDLIRVNILFLSLSLILSIYLLRIRDTSIQQIPLGCFGVIYQHYKLDGIILELMNGDFQYFPTQIYGIYLNNNLIY